MKTSVRFFSLLLAVLMIAGAVLTASAEKTEKIANDEALQFLVKLGVFGGYEDGSLRPDNKVERDEMAKIIFTLSTTFTDAGAGTVSFADVPANDWSAGYISWCSAKGIVGGYGNGNFGPNDYVTYDQALKMVAGAMGYNEWDSNLWPTDVRMLTLTTLGLGENLESVKGDDYVTRAQIAQIVYNAFGKPMKETVKGPFNSVQYLTLKADVWGVTEASDKIVSTENYFLLGYSKTEAEDEIELQTYGEATLEELGLDSYKGKTDNIIGAEVNLIYRAGEILGTTIKSIYTSEVELTKDKENKLYVNGVEVNSENPVNIKTVQNNGYVSYETYDALPSEYAYELTGADMNADGKVDVLEINYYMIGKVSAVTKSSVVFDNITGGTDANFTVKNEYLTSSTTLVADDVVLLKKVGPKVEVVEVIKPIVASATKFGNGKIGIAGREYLVNEQVFQNLPAMSIDATILDKNSDGKAKEFNFFVYGDSVFAASEVEKEILDSNFAVLAYVNTPSDPVLDVQTQTFSESYTAVLVINGKEKLVSLNPTETIVKEDGTTVLSFKDDTNDVLAAYGKDEHIVDGYLQAPYTLVSYIVDEDGKYTLKLKDTGNADYHVLEPGAKLTYNENLKLYTVEGNINSDRVVMNDASALYYTYQKPETTGDHLYLGVYTNKNLAAKKYEEIKTVGYSYLVKGEKDNVYTIAAVMLEGELKEVVEKRDYKTDARLIRYCSGNSTSEMIVEKNNGIYYTHNLMDMSKLKNEATLYTDKTVGEGAVALNKGYFYVYDEEQEEYLLVTKDTLGTLGMTCISDAKLTEVLNGYIYTDSGKYADGVKIPESAIIWAPAIEPSNGDAYTDKYTQVTIDGLAAALEIAQRHAEEDNKTYDIRLIFFTYLDSKNEEQIAYVLTDFYSETKDGILLPHSKEIHNNFGV